MPVASISSVLENAWNGEPWHALSLQAILADVTPAEASARPIPGAHSIQELVFHLAAWTGEVVARAGGRAPREPDEGDWPDVRSASWAEARERLAAAHGRLAEAVASFPESRLGDTVGATHEAPLGTGVTFERMLLGVAEHYAYHGGQVAILKRALRG